MRIQAITTYPIKGLPGVLHQTITAHKDAVLPGDRAYGLSADTEIGRQAEIDSWQKKSHFLQLMSLSRLASFQLDYEAAAHHLRLSLAGDVVFDGHLSDTTDAARLCDVIADYLGYGPDMPKPRLFHPNEGGLTDTKTPYVAFGNQSSMSDFADKIGIDDDARRYRLNVMIEGLGPFEENELIGKIMRIGTASFRFVEPVGRCAAIEVDPKTAERRKGLVRDLQTSYGMTDMGLFAEVISTGQFSVGDKLIEI